MTLHLVERPSRPEAFSALARLEQAAMDALPEATWLCASDGRMIRFNRKAAELWGRTPNIADPEERFCGASCLLDAEGGPLPIDRHPVAVALRTGDAVESEELVIEQPGGRRLTVLASVAPLAVSGGQVAGAVATLRDITPRREAEERRRQLIDELNHRVKNTLATVHSLAANTARNATSISQFSARFEARLQALSQAYTLLGEGQWQGAKLFDVVAQQLEPFGGPTSPRVRVEGPDVALEPRLALAFSMMFHELMTNAAKYGPLSVAEGQILVAWELVAGPEGARMLALQWVEAGGPPVKTPRRTGFGTRLIRSIASGLNGEAQLLFERSGLQLKVKAPIRD